MNENRLKQIPYGISDFYRIRTENYYYVDKTHFIPSLEGSGSFLFMVRPRRFGKSLLLSMLASYYDCKQVDDFDTLFGGLWIHDNPTVNRSRFLVMQMDFSRVVGDISAVGRRFDSYCSLVVEDFAMKYEDLFYPGFADEVKKAYGFAEKLDIVSLRAKRLKLPLYLIVDEYDNFTNNILNAIGLKEYKEITHGVGFYRDMFKLFKGNFDRILMFGVSPVTLDDLTSGYNIALNITTDPIYNQFMGFSEHELSEIVDYYRAAGCFDEPTSDIVKEMKPWYDNNCFSPKSIDEPKVFNSNMALYYLRNMIEKGCPPANLIDPNVKTDYKKLKRLIEIDGTNSERERIIQQIATDGYIRSQLITSFPAERIGDSVNYVSLLFYYGMLTIQGVKGIDTIFAIPNHCINDLYYSYMRDIYNPDGLIEMGQLERSFNTMAEEGNPIDFVTYVAQLFSQSSSVRTLIDGERAVQAFLLAFLKLTPYYVVKTERELNHGYADFVLLPNPKYDNVEHCYVIELKYITKADDSAAVRNAKMAEAEEQLRRYSADEEFTSLPNGITPHAIALVFAGEELADWKEVF